jgi:fructokinase
MGETLVDLVPGPNGREAVLGGSPYNVAIGLGRLGASMAIASSLSTDADGQRFKAALTADGIDLSYVAYSDAQSPTALVEEGTTESGPRYVFTLAGTAFDVPPALPQSWPDELRHIHVGSFSTLVPPMAGAVFNALLDAKGHRTTSYPDVAPHDAIQAWLKRGPRLAVLTRGAKGAEAFTEIGHLSVRAPVIKVQDTVGAGDSLMSSLLFVMDRDGALGLGHAAWTQALIKQWLSFAVRASAYTCTQKGSNPPRLADLV